MTLPPGPAALPAPRACLVVLDGWGLAEPGPGNAISLASTPVFDELWDGYPHTTLRAWGRAVGLPEGQMGNSEVGHLNLGAGAVVRQDLVRIDDALADGSLAANPLLREAFGDAERVHLIGLVSDGGVHSSLEHLRGTGVRGPGAGGSGRRDPRLHRRTRHAPAHRDGLPAGARRDARRPRGLGGGSLLGDGPRPPLGPHPACL